MICQSSPGSILDILKKRGWAIFIECATTDFGFFEIRIILTSQGIDKSSDIIDIVMQTIELIRDKCTKKQYFVESF
ncbi:hypothetical protein DSO57_1020341 [Entomophthora muscae]|uniref:Uncharacterized protein n=1 Tax=Entomophthora muscae TaxID=34485 RepID=A0ACC2T3Z1_9FUNG|nr:hypothetical protein DSO57_1020341 [Entomophthora muscae]